MTPKGGKRDRAGRPKVHDKPITRRHVYLSAEVYEWLSRTGNASAEIERLAREAMEGENGNSRGNGERGGGWMTN